MAMVSFETVRIETKREEEIRANYYISLLIFLVFIRQLDGYGYTSGAPHSCPPEAGRILPKHDITYPTKRHDWSGN